MKPEKIPKFLKSLLKPGDLMIDQLLGVMLVPDDHQYQMMFMW